MPDNDDLRMNQNETLNCKLALMGVWTEACREAAAYFGVNPDGSGNFSSVTQAQAGSTAGTLAVDGISADEMTSRLAASLVEHFPDKTDIITGVPAAALLLIHISEPTRQAEISYAVFCLKNKTIQQCLDGDSSLA